MAYSVYRFYNSDDRVIYIGRSSRLPQRIKAHFKHKPWWSEATRIELEHFESEQQMVEREAELIGLLRPAYNVALMGSPPRPVAIESHEPFRCLADAAERYSVPVAMVDDWRKQGMPAFRIAGKIVVRFSQVDAWLAGHSITA